MAKKIPFAIYPVVLKIKLTSTDLLERSHPQNQALFCHGAQVSALSPSALPAPSRGEGEREGGGRSAEEKDGCSGSWLVRREAGGFSRPVFISTDRRT